MMTCSLFCLQMSYGLRSIQLLYPNCPENLNIPPINDFIFLENANI